MASRKTISINSVLLDPENARHGDKASQHEIYAWMCGDGIAHKVLKLATEIARVGTSPLEIPGVIPAPAGARKPWVVVEGNRRLAALKFLNNPKLCPNQKLRKQYERLKASAEYPIASKIEFVIFESIETARYWIQTRHGGENGGAGIIDWGPMELDNFSARFGNRTTNRPAVEMLAYAYRKGLIDQNEYMGVPVTTLYRLISSPVFRQAIGCDLEKGQLYKISDDQYFDRAVGTLLKILASGQKSVTKLKSKEQRNDFATELKRDGNWGDYKESPRHPVNSFIPDEISSDSAKDDFDLAKSTPTPTPSGSTKARSGLRDRLFSAKGHGLVVSPDQEKVHDILRELVTLKHSGRNGTPISVAFLLRALIELSSDNYLRKNPSAIRKLELNTSLREKIKYSARHMHSQGVLTEERLDVITRHCEQEGGMLNISTLQKYLHSTAFFPNGESLNSMWSEIKDYVIACW